MFWGRIRWKRTFCRNWVVSRTETEFWEQIPLLEEYVWLNWLDNTPPKSNKYDYKLWPYGHVSMITTLRCLLLQICIMYICMYLIYIQLHIIYVDIYRYIHIQLIIWSKVSFRDWMLTDDWCVMIQGTGAAGVARLSKTLRLLRFVRLARMSLGEDSIPSKVID